MVSKKSLQAFHWGSEAENLISYNWTTATLTSSGVRKLTQSFTNILGTYLTRTGRKGREQTDDLGLLIATYLSLDNSNILNIINTDGLGSDLGQKYQNVPVAIVA